MFVQWSFLSSLNERINGFLRFWLFCLFVRVEGLFQRETAFSKAAERWRPLFPLQLAICSDTSFDFWRAFVNLRALFSKQMLKLLIF